MTTTQAKKITLTTVKKFVKDNADKLFINVKSSFDGMTDGCESRHNGFQLEAFNNNEAGIDLDSMYTDLEYAINQLRRAQSAIQKAQH